MANEISVSARLKVAKGYLSLEKQATITPTMSGSVYSTAAQTIGTTHGVLGIASDVATKGYAWFRNLDTTNYVEIGLEVSAAFQPLIKLKAGEVALVRLSNVSVYAKANTASVNLEWVVFAD